MTKKLIFILFITLFLPTSAFAKKSLYLYQENYFHWFSASGWMGNHLDLSINSASSIKPYEGKTCVKLSYALDKVNPMGWAGIYWQYPLNNWGEQEGRKNLKGMDFLSFYARGELGGEVVIFKVGGIQGDPYSDSDVADIQFTLTNKWKKYRIDLRKKDLSHIIGAFLVLIENRNNPKGATLYLDNIGFHK